MLGVGQIRFREMFRLSRRNRLCEALWDLCHPGDGPRVRSRYLSGTYWPSIS